MTPNRLLSATLALSMLAAPAFAQGTRPNPFNDQSSGAPPYQGNQSPQGNQPYQGNRGNQGFSYQGDQLAPSYDTRRPDNSDPRYSQTYREQRETQARPGGGCLKYGAVGAAGGHLAGHGVLGALAGCVTGAYVRHRDKEAIRRAQEQNAQ